MNSQKIDRRSVVSFSIGDPIDVHLTESAERKCAIARIGNPEPRTTGYKSYQSPQLLAFGWSSCRRRKVYETPQNMVCPDRGPSSSHTTFVAGWYERSSICSRCTMLRLMPPFTGPRRTILISTIRAVRGFVCDALFAASSDISKSIQFFSIVRATECFNPYDLLADILDAQHTLCRANYSIAF